MNVSINIESLKGVLLDYFVAKATGAFDQEIEIGNLLGPRLVFCDDAGYKCELADAAYIYDFKYGCNYMPHKDEAMLYQIINEGRVNVQHCSDTDSNGNSSEYVIATKDGISNKNEKMDLAVLRCFVTSKLGFELTYEDKTKYKNNIKKLV